MISLKDELIYVVYSGQISEKEFEKRAKRAAGKNQSDLKKRFEENEKTKASIKLRLNKYLESASVLYELLCFGNNLELENKAQNIETLTDQAMVYVFGGSNVFGFGRSENEPAKFNFSKLMRFGDDFWVAEFVLWNEVELFLMPYKDEKMGFVCQVMERYEVYEEPENPGQVNRLLDVICEPDLNRLTALGLIERYSGIFVENNWRIDMLDGEFVSPAQYAKHKVEELEERELDRKLADIADEERRRVEAALDDPEFAWLYKKEKESKSRGAGRWFLP